MIDVFSTNKIRISSLSIDYCLIKEKTTPFTPKQIIQTISTKSLQSYAIGTLSIFVLLFISVSLLAIYFGSLCFLTVQRGTCSNPSHRCLFSFSSLGIPTFLWILELGASYHNSPQVSSFVSMYFMIISGISMSLKLLYFVFTPSVSLTPTYVFIFPSFL